MDEKKLISIAARMAAAGKGILAMDESHPTCDKRFEKLGIEASEENRRAYRTMLVTTPGLGEYISGAILFDETIRQRTLDGRMFADCLDEAGIIPGIKVDAGAKEFVGYAGEKVTEGLDGLSARLREYADLGARFAKWRAVIAIGDSLPSEACVKANAYALARYARICQERDMAPIVEPEVLMDGAHTIERCYEVTEYVHQTVFSELQAYGVCLKGMVLKPNMVVSGSECGEQADAETIAKMTLRCLRATVPPSVPGVAFLSGGQSDAEAAQNLDFINRLTRIEPAPWRLTFSYGRALQQEAMKAWGGDNQRIPEARQVVHKRARLNALASAGAYDSRMEAE